MTLINEIFIGLINNSERRMVGGDKWSPSDRKLLISIVNNADKGMLRRVLADCDTKVRLSRYDAWQRVT